LRGAVTKAVTEGGVRRNPSIATVRQEALKGVNLSLTGSIILIGECPESLQSAAGPADALNGRKKEPDESGFYRRGQGNSGNRKIVGTEVNAESAWP
jgi:hypothetical protein